MPDLLGKSFREGTLTLIRVFPALPGLLGVVARGGFIANLAQEEKRGGGLA